MEIKDKLAKGLTVFNVKTSNFMEINKIKTYLDALEGEVRDMKYRIGSIMYDKITTSCFEIKDVEGTIKRIAEKTAIIEEQKKKIEQLELEEKMILGTAASGAIIYCTQCGEQNDANYKYCCKCGQPL